jgi:hypothetical protein
MSEFLTGQQDEGGFEMAIQPVGTTASTRDVHYVDWAPIFAGTVVASAIATVLATFGAAIGLSMVSPYIGESASKPTYFVTMGLWSLLVVIASFLCGGYIAGRLRKRLDDAGETEVEVRDGAHGLTVWALGVVVASLLLAVGVSGAAGSAAHVAAAADRRGDLTQYTVDALFRAAQTDSGRVLERTGGRLSDADRQEVGRLLTYGLVKGELNDNDRTYLASVVADRTGLTRSEADARVREVLAEAKHRADVARKAGVVVGFLTAVMLLVGAVIAIWAATLGGRHRDRETGASRFWRWTYS